MTKSSPLNPLLYLLRTWKCFFLSAMVSNARNDSSECVNVCYRPKADMGHERHDWFSH